MNKRLTHIPEFQARVDMETISSRKTIEKVAANHTIDPMRVTQWKRQLLEGASNLFSRSKKHEQTGKQDKEAELFQQIGMLQMELERLKNLRHSETRELHKMSNQYHLGLGISRQYHMRD